MNRAHLEQYAKLLAFDAGCPDPAENKNRMIEIRGEEISRELAELVADAARNAGHRNVCISLVKPDFTRTLIQKNATGGMDGYFLGYRESVATLRENNGVYICLWGQEFPEMMTELSRTHPKGFGNYKKREALARQEYFVALNREELSYVGCGIPTRAWAKKVFPELPEHAALDKLWECVFSYSLADRTDPIAAAKAELHQLRNRCALLDRLGITCLHIGDPRTGTDLFVGLHKLARWRDAAFTDKFPQAGTLNRPTKEVYTIPHRDQVHGTLVATMPFEMDGVVIEDAEFVFGNGLVLDYHASNEDQLERFLKTDAGASRLGEFALVGIDSDIARSGIFFYDTLFDENAGPHAALGGSYACCLEGGVGMSDEDRLACGFNPSAQHCDVIFRSATVNITAMESKQGKLPLIRNGAWEEPFLSAQL